MVKSINVAVDELDGSLLVRVGMPREVKPTFVQPMVLREADELPPPPGWIYEVKWDGWRILASKDGQDVRLWSRNRKLLTRRFPGMVAAVRALPVEHVLIDGEAIAFGADGLPSFEEVERHPGVASLMAFDLLHVDGADLRDLPLEQRRRRLAKLVLNTQVMFSTELTGSPDTILENARTLRIEGVVAKRRGSHYSSSGRRSRDWLKVKLRCVQEFVVGGYLPPVDMPSALFVGFYDRTSLRFAACVQNGLSNAVRKALVPALRMIESERCPFSRLPVGRGGRFGEAPTKDQVKHARWVQPLLVAQVEFLEWTSRGMLRQPAFRGIRADKNAEEVRREIAPRP